MNGITLQGLDLPILANDAILLRDNAIKIAVKVREVSSLPSEEMALEALTMLQKLERGMEKSRKDVKSKPLDLCKRIDEIALGYSDSLRMEVNRIKKLLGDYAEIKRQEALEEERKRQEEIRKIQEAQRLAEEEARKAAIAQAEAEERARIAQEKLNNAKSEKERAIAEKMDINARLAVEAHARLLAEASNRAQEQDDAIRDSLPVVAAKANGASTKFTLKFRVTDINELFANYPHVCELTEKKSAVNMLINGMHAVNPNEIPKVKGLQIWTEANVTTISR